MALRVGLNRLNTSTLRNHKSVISILDNGMGKRWKSSDQGDVIGIDLGTTNSCVAIMVSLESKVK